MGNHLYQDMKKNIDLASQGRDFWINLVEANKLGGRDYVLLMPSYESEINYYGLVHLDAFLQKVGSNKCLLLVCNDRVKDLAYHFTEKAIEVINVSRSDAEKIMKLYSLYNFTDKLIVLSLDEPAGRSGKYMVGKKGITLEDMVAIGIYGLKSLEGGVKIVELESFLREG